MNAPGQHLPGFATRAAAWVATGAAPAELAEAFREAAGGLPYPAALLDAGGTYLAVNVRYARALNLAPSALTGRRYAPEHGERLGLPGLVEKARRSGAAQDSPAGAVNAGRVTPLTADAGIFAFVLECHTAGNDGGRAG